VGQRAADVLSRAGTWHDWLDIAPLVPGMSERAEMLPLETLLETHLGHLAEVCHRPRTHLRIDVERTAVSRARRFAAQAANYLAAHTEDWERPTLRAVVPKRILAVVREDQFDIYENRVAARLVDHLLAYLNRRVFEVSRLLRVFEEVADYSNAAAGGSHWRQHRIYRLWGSALDAHEGRRKAERTLRRLQHLQYTVAGLIDSLLFREVPPRATVSTTLTMTNILANDPHYRRVAELWRTWARWGQDPALRPRELFEDRQRLCAYFSTYCLLLMAHALDQIGFEPEDRGHALRDNEDVVLRSATSSVTLLWSSTDGIVTLRRDGIQLLRVVPLASAVAMLDAEAVCAFVDEVDAGVSPSPPYTTVVAYPTPPSVAAYKRLGDGLAHRLHALPHEVPHEACQRVGFLPVSPWDIGSVERFARLVRWTTLAPLHLAYPPQVHRPHGIDLGRAVTWCEESDDIMRVVRAPSDDERETLRVEQKVGEASERLEELRRECESVSEEIRRARRKHDATGRRLNATKRVLDAQITAAEQQRTGLLRFVQEMGKAEALLRALLRCPTCARTADARHDFKAGPGCRFVCTCAECATTWGTVACPRCRQWIPTLLPRIHDGAMPDERQWGRVDRIFGADVLAVPCARSDREQSFVCPSCGQCGCPLDHVAR
jgi:hypothetical protein